MFCSQSSAALLKFTRLRTSVAACTTAATSIAGAHGVLASLERKCDDASNGTSDNASGGVQQPKPARNASSAKNSPPFCFY